MESFHEKLKEKIDLFVHTVYKVTKSFPSDERYGVTSQLRRSSLSVALNYVEGYGRRRPKQYQYFIEMSFGSLKEARYLIEFSYHETYISKDEFVLLNTMGDELSRMLWGILRSMDFQAQ